MKNSDMKVIAIILSIALLFTIITSNAVSVVSVITLLKDGGTVATDGAPVEGDDAANGGATNTGSSSTGSSSTGSSSTGSSSTGSSSIGSSSTGSSSTGSSSTGSSSTGSSSTGSSSTGSSSTGTDANSGSTSSDADNGSANTDTDANSGSADTNADNGSANNGDANAPAEDTGADNAILADPFAAYSKAANDIHTNAIAGYKKIGWQAVEGDLQLSKFSFLAGTLTSLISGFMTEKDAAEVKDCPKGSDDAKNRMPASNCSASHVKSATAVQDGENYVVTIVLNEFTNPSYDDPDGLQLMSREFLDIKDVVETVETDETVSKIVSKVDGTIVYKDYTITATMNANGQFIKIVHFGRGDINADVTAVGVGDLQASGALSFNAEYYDFVY